MSTLRVELRRPSFSKTSVFFQIFGKQVSCLRIVTRVVGVVQLAHGPLTLSVHREGMSCIPVRCSRMSLHHF